MNNVSIYDLERFIGESREAATKFLIGDLVLVNRIDVCEVQRIEDIWLCVASITIPLYNEYLIAAISAQKLLNRQLAEILYAYDRRRTNRKFRYNF